MKKPDPYVRSRVTELFFGVLPLLAAIVLIPAGCATSILPTSWLEHRDAGRGGGMRTCWTDESVKMYSIRDVVVREFAADKAVGATDKLDRHEFGRRIRDLMILDLRRYGKNAVHDVRTLPGTSPFLLIEGHIAQLNPGNPEDRYRFGFGAGRALVDVEVRVYVVRDGRPALCAEFGDYEAKSHGVVGETTVLLDYCMRRISRTMTRYIATHGNEK